MTNIPPRNHHAKRPVSAPVTNVSPTAAPMDQPALADQERDRRLATAMASNPNLERIARLRKETTDAENEADGVLTDEDQMERAQAHAPTAIAPDPNGPEFTG